MASGLETFKQEANTSITSNSNAISELQKNEVNIEDFPKLEGESTADWFSRIINEKPYRLIKARTNKTYYLNEPIIITQHDVYVDFNMANLASQGVITNQIEIVNTANVTVKNFFTTKNETDSGDCIRATNVEYLTIENIVGFTTGFGNLINLIGVSKASISNIKVQNSNATKKGNGLAFNYCVNVNVDNVYLGFFSYGIRLFNGSSTTGYKNEGIHFNRINVVKCVVGMQMESGTLITLSQVIFDFCSSFGVYVLGGNGLNISQYWLGLQDGAVSGFEVVNHSSGIYLNMGTIAGDWAKKANQKAFYSAVDTIMDVNNVYLIDVNGGNLGRSLITVSNDRYFHSGQTEITKFRYGNKIYKFTGATNTNAYFNTIGSYFTIYSYKKSNPSEFLKSEGVINEYGALLINKTASGGIGANIKHVAYNSFNIMLETTEDVTGFETIINMHYPEVAKYTRTL